MAKPITQRAGTNYGSATKNQEVTVDAEGTKVANFPRMQPVSAAKAMAQTLPNYQYSANSDLISGAGAAATGINASASEGGNDNTIQLGGDPNSNTGEATIAPPSDVADVYSRSGQLGRNFMKQSRIYARENNLTGKEKRDYMKSQRETKRSKMAEYRRINLGGENAGFWNIDESKATPLNMWGNAKIQFGSKKNK